MSRFRWGVTVALGVAALAIPAGAIASKGDNHGHHNANGHTKTHNVAYVFKGAYEGESTVKVAHGNARVRKGGFVGETVAFDLSAARIVVSDANNDQSRDLNDVQVGDEVLVKAMLPKNDPGSQPFAAKRLIDQTHPPTE
jgi:hypothetical protein